MQRACLFEFGSPAEVLLLGRFTSSQVGAVMKHITVLSQALQISFSFEQGSLISSFKFKLIGIYVPLCLL